MHYVTAALAVILLAVVVIFALQNRDAVELTFLAWSMSIPKLFLILGTYVLGMLSGWGLLEVLKRAF